MSDLGRTQIPIVCPGHTRPLAELQYLWNEEEQRTLLLSACHDKMPMLRDGTSGDWIGTFQGHKGAVWSCQMDDSGNLAATASGDYSARVWDAITGHSLLELPHKHIVKTCVFSPDSKVRFTLLFCFVLLLAIAVTRHIEFIIHTNY
jgi:serine-threonine kinase receptor-associated protein